MSVSAKHSLIRQLPEKTSHDIIESPKKPEVFTSVQDPVVGIEWLSKGEKQDMMHLEGSPL